MPTTPTANTPAVSEFSLKDFLSSFLLVELFKGMALTGKYAFKSKITLEYPEEKHHSLRDSVGCMLCAGTKTVKSGASLVSCAKQFVLRWRSRLSRMFGQMGLVVPRGMTLI